MQWTGTVLTRSGYAALFERAVPGDAGEPDLELLQMASARGDLLFWPALDDETTIHLLVDEPVPARMARRGHVEARMTLGVPSGQLRLADPTALAERGGRLSPAGPAAHAVIAVEPGRYATTVLILDWPAAEVDRELRRRAGGLAVGIRDALGLGTFFLGALTLVGLPVFLVGRALDDGLAGALASLGFAGLVLVPVWLLVFLAWRLPTVRAVDRADEAVAALHPDVVVSLERII